MELRSLIKPWTAEDIIRMRERAEAERTRPGWREEQEAHNLAYSRALAQAEARRAAAEKRRWARAEREGRIGEELQFICPCGRGGKKLVKVILPPQGRSKKKAKRGKCHGHA
jgi:hypothetical protein